MVRYRLNPDYIQITNKTFSSHAIAVGYMYDLCRSHRYKTPYLWTSHDLAKIFPAIIPLCSCRWKGTNARAPIHVNLNLSTSKRNIIRSIRVHPQWYAPDRKYASTHGKYRILLLHIYNKLAFQGSAACSKRVL